MRTSTNKAWPAEKYSNDRAGEAVVDYGRNGPHRDSHRPEDELKRYRRLRWIRPRTPERLQQERIYRERVKEWLRKPENRWCRVYLLLTGRRVPATQCHHYQGRRGMLLLCEHY